ncbi:MAG: endonuclease MutS2, partial [Synergistaceae bacterium]|nr:endonuclease MutS2 [Synergistaceae bacterium]
MLAERSSYNSLEIKKIIRLISKYCRSEIGEATALAAVPAQNFEELKARHEIFSSIEDYRETKGELPWQNGLASVTPMLAEADETGLLTGEELLKIRHLIKLSMKIKEILNSEKDKYPIFTLITKDIRDFTDEIEKLSVIDDDGRLYDSASEKLKSLREKIKEIRETIRRKGHALINDPSISGMLQERVMTLRNGRYTFLVRPDALSIFPGTVVDRSVSGNSVYMEPNSMVRLNNESTSCRNSEIYEEQRILRELTVRIQKKTKKIMDAERVIGTIDLLYALSEKMRIERWTMPELSPKTIFSFKKARHPLLFEKAVPIDIGCGDKYRILVITGPNTGGKTVALKTAGVCVILGWMGFPIPAGEGSV